MKQLKQAVRQAIAEGNWYSALASALALPDICGWLEYPNKNVGERYILWYNSYMKETYTGIGGKWNDEKEYVWDENDELIFLHGKDCYALRCAYLHHGLDDITSQSARSKLLHKFKFFTPPKTGEPSKHLVLNIALYDDKPFSQLQLEVDRFCEDICCGVDQWEINVEMQEDIQERLGQLLVISES